MDGKKKASLTITCAGENMKQEINLPTVSDMDEPIGRETLYICALAAALQNEELMELIIDNFIKAKAR